MIELSIFGIALIIMGATDRIIDGINLKYEHIGYTFMMFLFGILCIVGSIFLNIWNI